MASLRRDGKKVLSVLSDLPGQPVITKAALTVQFPVRFKEVELAKISANTFAYGLMALILETGEYALFNVNALVELGPAPVEISEIEGVEYFSFRYQPGDVVIKTKDLVCRSSLIYKAIEEFVFKGKVPWYLDYEDMGKIFDTAKKHANTSATILPSIVEFMASYIARSKADRTRYLREVAKTPSDYARDKLTWVPLRSVYWSAPGTVNKLAGAYFQDGVVSAIVNPSDTVPKIESILRA